MKTILQTVALLPLLAISAVTANPAVSCRTELGRKSVKYVPTSTKTITSAHRPTVTVVVRPTVTSHAGHEYTYTHFTTKTKTVTNTAVTDVFYSTFTQFDVETDTDTATITSTQIDTSTTSSTSTTEIATTTGFRNIRDTLNHNTLQRRALDNPHARREPEKRAAAHGVLAMSHPTKVDCTKTLPNTHTSTVHRTLHAVTTVIPYWAWKTTKTKTLTTTKTLVPKDVSSTITSTSTSSVTTYTTSFATDVVTSTSTTTSVIPGPTVFDACSQQNIFGSDFTHSGYSYYVSNADNNGPGIASDLKTIADGASTAVECCNACQRFGTCETYLFRATNRNCFLLYHEGETCTSQFNHPNFVLSKSGSDTGAGYVVGNGNCGYTYSGNSDGTVYSVDL